MLQSYFSVNGSNNIQNFINSTSILLRFTSSTPGELCNLDYLSILLHSPSSPSSPSLSPTSPPPATVGGRLCQEGYYFIPRPQITWQIQFSDGPTNTSVDVQLLGIFTSFLFSYFFFLSFIILIVLWYWYVYFAWLGDFWVA